MADKLNLMDQFPEIVLTTAAGEQIRLPADVESDYAVVTFQELVSEPRSAVEEIYARLGFDISDAYAAFLDEEQRRSRAYESQHRYDADALGIPRERVRERLGHLYERFGWPLEDD